MPKAEPGGPCKWLMLPLDYLPPGRDENDFDRSERFDYNRLVFALSIRTSTVDRAVAFGALSGWVVPALTRAVWWYVNAEGKSPNTAIYEYFKVALTAHQDETLKALEADSVPEWFKQDVRFYYGAE